MTEDFDHGAVTIALLIVALCGALLGLLLGWGIHLLGWW